MNAKTRFIVQSAAVAALYSALGIFAYFPAGPFQVRVAEAMTVLPCFMPAAIPGLCVGCLISNIITGCAPWDVVFGTLATLIGAVGTRLLKNHRWAAPLPPIVANTIILPPVLTLVYGEKSYLVLLASVAVGEIVSCGIIGTLVNAAIMKYEKYIQ